MEIRRTLAQQNPQAFLPDLAMSLGAYGIVLRGLKRPAEAAQAFAEGLRAVLPPFRAFPQAFPELAAALLQEYLQACQEAGEEPDAALVEGIAEDLGKLPFLHPAVVRLAPLLLAVVGVARGRAGGEEARAVEAALAGLRAQADWRALAEALARLLAGTRDPVALRRDLPLDAVDEQALALAERAVSEDATLALLLAMAKAATETPGAEVD